MEQIGKRLRALREGIRLTQVQMAQILGVQQSRINRFETGQSTPSPDVFLKYADYFDVSLDYIFARTDNPQGKSYDFHPQHDPQHEELRRFLDMCFEPGTPANAKLKDSLYGMMEEQK